MRKLILITLLLLVACAQPVLEDPKVMQPEVVEPEVIEPEQPEEPKLPSSDKLSVKYRNDESLYDYGSNADPRYVQLAQAHCQELDGEFNECGSACRPREICISVCVLTCDVSAKKTKHIVKIENLKFTPKILTINKGDTVEFTNVDDVSHTATANGGYFSSPLLGRGQSWSVKFKDPGSYQYHSSPYRVAKGEIYVRN